MVVLGTGLAAHWKAPSKRQGIGNKHCEVVENLQISSVEKIPSQTPWVPRHSHTLSRHNNIFIFFTKHSVHRFKHKWFEINFRSQNTGSYKVIVRASINRGKKGYQQPNTQGRTVVLLNAGWSTLKMVINNHLSRGMWFFSPLCFLKLLITADADGER